jgi:hypothetical protein
MARQRDPRTVLGVRRGASPAEIKAAWRQLARQNHPDLTGDDPAASQSATRRMAEINDAYESLTRIAAEEANGTAGGPGRTSFETEDATRRSGPPRPKQTRPVTARVDTSQTFRPRNQAMGGNGRTPLSGQPPARSGPVHREPPRASTPTGPLVRHRPLHLRRRPVPSLDDAQATVISFGKFHDHSLGEIAAFEPSYIDWVASTVNHDPDLVDAARVIQADLDQRGVVRRAHASVDRRGRSA